MTPAAAVDRLVERVPELQEACDEHLRDNAELLPHVLFGDVFRFVVAAEASGAEELVDRTLSALEALLHEDADDIRNLVAVSFVENVAWDDDDASKRIRRRLPSLLADALRRQRERRP